MLNLIGRIIDLLICVTSAISAITAIKYIKDLIKEKKTSVDEHTHTNINNISMLKISFWILSVILIFIILILFILKSFFISYVPSVKGLTYPEACSILAEHDLSFNKFDYDNLDQYRVTKQSKEDEYVINNTMVTLSIEKIIRRNKPPADLPTIDCVSISLFENIADVHKVNKNDDEYTFHNTIDISNLDINNSNAFIVNKSYNQVYNFIDYDSNNGLLFNDVPVGEYDIIINIDGYAKKTVLIDILKKDSYLKNGETIYGIEISLDKLNQEPYSLYEIEVFNEKFEYIKNTSFYLNTMKNDISYKTISNENGRLDAIISTIPGTSLWLSSENDESRSINFKTDNEYLIPLLFKNDGSIKKINSNPDITNIESTASGKIIYFDEILNYGDNVPENLETFNIELNINFETYNNLSFGFEAPDGVGFEFNEKNITFKASQGVYQICFYGSDNMVLFNRTININKDEIFDIAL